MFTIPMQIHIHFCDCLSDLTIRIIFWFKFFSLITFIIHRKKSDSIFSCVFTVKAQILSNSFFSISFQISDWKTVPYSRLSFDFIFRIPSYSPDSIFFSGFPSVTILKSCPISFFSLTVELKILLIIILIFQTLTHSADSFARFTYRHHIQLHTSDLNCIEQKKIKVPE